MLKLLTAGSLQISKLGTGCITFKFVAGLATGDLSPARQTDEKATIRNNVVRITDKALLVCFILPSIAHWNFTRMQTLFLVRYCFLAG
jgi:hypothetical protein